MQIVGDGGTMGGKQPGIAFPLYILLQQHPAITFLSIKVEVGSKGRLYAGANGVKGQKLTHLVTDMGTCLF